MLTINEKEPGTKFGNVDLYQPFIFDAYLYIKTRACDGSGGLGSAVRVHAKSGSITHFCNEFSSATRVKLVKIKDVIVDEK